MRKIYISGPMRGYPELNHPAFFAAESAVELLGEVVSPARMGVVPGFSQRDYAKRDLAVILECDDMYMLTGWEFSWGARAEHAVARWIGLKMHYQKDYDFVGNRDLQTGRG